MIRGYHKYKKVWDDPVDGEELECKREIRNSHDTHTVAVRRMIDGEEKTVGHVPRRLSAICSLFIRSGGAINCRVNGHRRYSADLPQGGLKIPCILTFVVNNHKEGKKAQQLLGDALSVEVCQCQVTLARARSCCYSIYLPLMYYYVSVRSYTKSMYHKREHKRMTMTTHSPRFFRQ